MDKAGIPGYSIFRRALVPVGIHLAGFLFIVLRSPSAPIQRDEFGKRLNILTSKDPSVTSLRNAYLSLERLFAGTDGLPDGASLLRDR